MIFSCSMEMCLIHVVACALLSALVVFGGEGHGICV